MMRFQKITKIFLLGLCLGFSVIPSFAQSKKQLEQGVGAFEKAMISRDAEAVKELLAPDFMIGVYDGDEMNYLLEGLVKQYYAIESITFQGNKKHGELVLANVKIQLEKGEEITTNLAFNKDAQLTYVDLFDGFYDLDRYSDHGLVATIPFVMENNKIIIKATMNDSEKVLRFIFDTGADGMALSPEAAEEVQVKHIRDHETAVVGGKTTVKFSSGNTVHLAEELSLDKQNLVIFPGMDSQVDGLIGGGILRKYTTQFDFDRKVIELYDFNSFQPNPEAAVLDVDFSSGVPEIPISYYLANKEEELTAEMVFDTGAGYSMIFFGPYVGQEQLSDGFEAAFHSTNYSMGMATPIQIGYIDYARIGDHKMENILVSLQQYDPQNKDWITSSGSFGIALIKKFHVTIDRLHKKLYMEPNQVFAKPSDFAIGGMVLHFNEDDELEIKQVIQGSAANREGLKVGSKITMIDDFTSEDLLSDGLGQLLDKAAGSITVRVLYGEQMMQLDLEI
ncbi:aspartyl protease family protein [Echinicola sp. CAU 1574]|uniref:Aspartyl protease family protein n=1 Tax=Echinicola arenosa TaxID=2774144 RepID=A0ABR9AFW8_9BACT|nr:aspartyl protease family protein [Echinicola arenosa]MBD8487755.1 aspartyl protease family protein [Echinicola arenosa]